MRIAKKRGAAGRARGHVPTEATQSTRTAMASGSQLWVAAVEGRKDSIGGGGREKWWLDEKNEKCSRGLFFFVGAK